MASRNFVIESERGGEDELFALFCCGGGGSDGSFFFFSSLFVRQWTLCMCMVRG